MPSFDATPEVRKGFASPFHPFSNRGVVGAYAPSAEGSILSPGLSRTLRAVVDEAIKGLESRLEISSEVSTVHDPSKKP